jgi:hypothetical protein
MLVIVTDAAGLDQSLGRAPAPMEAPLGGTPAP